MAGKLKLLVCCGNGAGTSMMIKLNVEKVIKKMGIDVQSIYHCAISEGKSLASQYDVVLCSKNFVPMFKQAEEKGTKIVGLKNVMSAKEIEEGLIAAGVN
ncbi:PTS sugar transporter subunit IIB [Candidatus Arthromitus sp. SFB-turkey]|uniref:PTS sugar transporter subunit IIB n=1 Tax=Candidatus Arthromitus sp. SFB-turkey TaxID=1840217 RepID=UPI0007F33ED2|nr:PTS sugar transporter subunit IIB [Candidatus Arthromitus sp. SFB-turkey]OAT89182.1 PTS ascorbate transporter subunit IIB [Candidatus Arthromitus sp. SFB-turkey]HJC99602.1 PTS sugar transporter subunit IIB [Candidatus Dwaynia gallinarum]